MNSKNTRTSGFSLTEVLVVLGCVLILAGPLIRAFQVGIKSGVTGLIQVETTLEARKICRQIEQDLQNACVLLDSSDANALAAVDPNSLVQKVVSGEATTFTLDCFPVHGAIGEFVNLPATIDPQSRATLIRKLSRVEYHLDRSTDPTVPVFVLKRTERFHAGHPLCSQYPDGLTTTLSSRVNVFDLRLKAIPNGRQTGPALLQNHYLYHVTLQLVQVFHKKSTDTSAAANMKEWEERQKGFIIADFFATVYPEHFNQLITRFWEKQNWYNVLESP